MNPQDSMLLAAMLREQGMNVPPRNPMFSGPIDEPRMVGGQPIESIQATQVQPGSPVDPMQSGMPPAPAQRPMINPGPPPMMAGMPGATQTSGASPMPPMPERGGGLLQAIMQNSQVGAGAVPDWLPKNIPWPYR